MYLPQKQRAISAMPSLAVLACVLLAGCSAPTPPDEERRPEPQAQPKSALMETANAYKDAARTSAAATEDAAKREQADLDAAAQ